MKDKSLYFFLHEYGYNAFNIPKLSPVEINFLIEGHKKRQKDNQKKKKK